MNVEERARFKALLEGFEQNALRDNEIKELIALGRKAEKAIEHMPLFCTFCGGMPGPGGRVLRPHMHCNTCDPIVGYRCGDPECECAK